MKKLGITLLMVLAVSSISFSQQVDGKHMKRVIKQEQPLKHIKLKDKTGVRPVKPISPARFRPKNPIPRPPKSAE